MYKRYRSFFNSTAACLLVAGLLVCKPPQVSAQAATEPDTTSADTLSADEQDIGPDPVSVTTTQTATATDTPQVLTDLADTSAQEPLPAEEAAFILSPKQPPLNRYTSEAFAVLQQRAADRPLLFSAVLAGLTVLLFMLAFIYSRRRRRTPAFAVLTRHHSHV